MQTITWRVLDDDDEVTLHDETYPVTGYSEITQVEKTMVVMGNRITMQVAFDPPLSIKRGG